MEEEKKYRWVKIADESSEIVFPANGIAEVKAEGKIICLGWFKGVLTAFAAKCPHAGGSFRDGYTDALGNVVCPLHRYKFCPANGRNITGEGYYLRHWPVEVRTDGVFVGFEKDKLFDLFPL